MDPTSPPAPYYVAFVGLANAVLAILAAFNVWSATDAQKTALIVLFAAGSVAAGLIYTTLHQQGVLMVHQMSVESRRALPSGAASVTR